MTTTINQNDFNATLNDNMNTLAKIWADKKVLSEREKYTVSNNMLQLEKLIIDKATENNASEDELTTLNNTAVILLNDYIATLDAKKDVKKIKLANDMIFKFENNIKIFLYAKKNNKDEIIRYHVAMATLKNLIKYEVSKSQINKANKLYSNDFNVDLNKAYNEKLIEIAETAKKALHTKQLETARVAGINSMAITGDNIADIIAVLTRKQSEFNATK